MMTLDTELESGIEPVEIDDISAFGQILTQQITIADIDTTRVRGVRAHSYTSLEIKAPSNLNKLNKGGGTPKIAIRRANGKIESEFKDEMNLHKGDVLYFDQQLGSASDLGITINSANLEVIKGLPLRQAGSKSLIVSRRLKGDSEYILEYGGSGPEHYMYVPTTLNVRETVKVRFIYGEKPDAFKSAGTTWFEWARANNAVLVYAKDYNADATEVAQAQILSLRSPKKLVTDEPQYYYVDQHKPKAYLREYDSRRKGFHDKKLERIDHMQK